VTFGLESVFICVCVCRVCMCVCVRGGGVERAGVGGVCEWLMLHVKMCVCV